MSGQVTSMLEEWEGSAPDWVIRLAEECAATSQVKVAKRLGRSGALVNQVLRNRYKGDMAGVEDCVRGLFMNGTIECPALGAIPSNECHDWIKKFRNPSQSNMLRIRMFRACKKCPRNTKEERT